MEVHPTLSLRTLTTCEPVYAHVHVDLGVRYSPQLDLDVKRGEVQTDVGTEMRGHEVTDPASSIEKEQGNRSQKNRSSVTVREHERE